MNKYKIICPKCQSKTIKLNGKKNDKAVPLQVYFCTECNTLLSIYDHRGIINQIKKIETKREQINKKRDSRYKTLKNLEKNKELLDWVETYLKQTNYFKFTLTYGYSQRYAKASNGFDYENLKHHYARVWGGYLPLLLKNGYVSRYKGKSFKINDNFWEGWDLLRKGELFIPQKSKAESYLRNCPEEAKIDEMYFLSEVETVDPHFRELWDKAVLMPLLK